MDSKDRERMITVQRYKEFYVGARCEIVSVHHPVFAKNIGTIVKIVTIYDSGCVEEAGMTNVVKFPRQKGGKPQQIRAVEDVAGPASENTVRNILYGVIGAVYMVLVILWIPVRFLLIANVVIQFFKMLFKWSDGPFAAAWPFVTSFLVLATLTYIMATWKPKVS